MGRRDLSMFVLQDVTHRPLQNSGAPATGRVETGGMLTQLISKTAGFNSDHAHRFVSQKRMKHADGIRAAADTGNQTSRQATLLFQDLFTGFASDDPLEIADHQRIWMRTEGTAKQVVSVGN